MICELSDEAVGLIPWTIVRTHRFSTGQHWRTGAFLDHTRMQSQALVELHAMKRRLDITVRAPFPDHFFGLLRDGLDRLFHERWPGLITEFKVPCDGARKSGQPCESAFTWEALLDIQQDGETTVRCTDCGKRHDLTRLLCGLGGARPQDSLVDALQQQMFELQQKADELRRLMKAMLSEDRTCPPLFTLIPKDRAAWNPRKLVDSAYLLQLWCTHPGHQHPVGEPYEITPPKEWLVKVAPYAGFALKALRLVVPIGDAAALTQLDSATIAVVKDELNLMDKVAAALPSDVGLGERLPAGPDGRARGAELRQLSVLLKELDPTEGWRGLSRVMDKASGDWHWVCPEHRAIYDPPLPDLSPHPPARAGQG